MKHWWKCYRLSCKLDQLGRPVALGPSNESFEPADPGVRAWLAVHTRLQESARTQHTPSPDLLERILQAVHFAESDPANRPVTLCWANLRRPAMAGAALIALVLALAIWFRPGPPHPTAPEPLALVTQTQIQAHQWVQRILDPDLQQLERELAQTQQEAQAALAHVLASIP